MCCYGFGFTVCFSAISETHLGNCDPTGNSIVVSNQDFPDSVREILRPHTQPGADQGLTIHVLAMTNFDDLYQDGICKNVVDEPVRSFAYAVCVMRTDQFFGITWEWIFNECVSGGDESLDDIWRKFFELFDG